MTDWSIRHGFDTQGRPMKESINKMIKKLSLNCFFLP